MSEDQGSPPRDMRQFRKESDRKSLYLAIFTLVVVGGLLIASFFGPESLLTALPCLLGGAALMLLPWIVLSLIGRWRDTVDIQAKHEAGLKSSRPEQESEQ